MIVKFLDQEERWIVIAGITELEVDHNFGMEISGSPEAVRFIHVSKAREMCPAPHRFYVGVNLPDGIDRVPVKVLGLKIGALQEYAVVPEWSEVYLMSDDGQTVDKF